MQSRTTCSYVTARGQLGLLCNYCSLLFPTLNCPAHMHVYDRQAFVNFTISTPQAQLFDKCLDGEDGLWLGCPMYCLTVKASSSR